MDDDGIIMSVYDDIHEELRVKNKAIDKLKGRVSTRTHTYTRTHTHTWNARNKYRQTSSWPPGTLFREELTTGLTVEHSCISLVVGGESTGEHGPGVGV